MDAKTHKLIADRAWQSAILNNFQRSSSCFERDTADLDVDRAEALALYLDIWSQAFDAQSEGDWE